MWTRIGWVLPALAAGCGNAERSPRDGAPEGGVAGDSSVGGTAGLGGSAGAPASGMSGGGSSGTPGVACTADGAICSPDERCVPAVFHPPRFFAAGPTPSSFELGDVNGDGHLDAVIVQGERLGVHTLLGAGDGAFASPAVAPTPRSARDLALGDFNGDGRVDVVIPGAPMVVQLGDGNASFAEEVVLEANGFCVAVGDLHNDGIPDLVVTCSGGVMAQVLRGDASGGFEPGEPFSVLAGEGTSRELSLADFDRDGALDLAVIDLQASVVSVLEGKGDGTFSEPRMFETGGADSWALLVADFSGDAYPDLAIANDTTSNVSLLLGAGDGSLAEARTYETGSSTGALAAADFDGDGTLDLAAGYGTEQGGAGRIRLFPGAGDGTLREARLFTIADMPGAPVGYWSALGAGDVDEDGRIDLVGTSATGRLVVLLASDDRVCSPAP